MPHIELKTYISAPIERCFNAARDISLHARLAHNTGERAIAGRVKGLIGPGEWVTFSGVHFGLRLRHTSSITEFSPPHRFIDEQLRGHFAIFKHTHIFEQCSENQILMRDVVDFTAPYGIFGRIAELAIEWHMRRFLTERAQGIKIAVEAEEKDSVKKF